MSYETKDSGKRMEFASGMKRDTQEGKTLYHLVYDGPMYDRWAELLTRGAVKYDEGNWMKAEGEAEFRRFKASAARHFRQWMRGDVDEDHGAATFFNINGAEYVKGKLGTSMPEPHLDPDDIRDCCGTSFGVEHRPNCHVKGYLARVQAAAEPEIPVSAFGVAGNPSDSETAIDLDECGTIDGVTPIGVYELLWDVLEERAWASPIPKPSLWSRIKARVKSALGDPAVLGCGH